MLVGFNSSLARAMGSVNADGSYNFSDMAKYVSANLDLQGSVSAEATNHVPAGSFGDIFHSAISGVAVKKFENKGLYGVIDETTFVFYASMTLEVKSVFYSTATVTTSGTHSRSDSHEWAYIWTFPNSAYPNDNAFKKHYAADVPEISVHLQQAAVTGARLSLTYSPPSQTPFVLNSTVNITIPQSELKMQQLTITQAQVTATGSQTSHVTGDQSTSGVGSVNLVGSGQLTSCSGCSINDADSTSVITKVDQLGLGIRAESATTSTRQASETNPGVLLETKPNLAAAPNSGSFDLPLRLLPEIRITNTPYTMKYAEVRADTVCDAWWPDCGVTYSSAISESRWTSATSVAFTNFDVANTYEIQADLFSTMSVNVPVSAAVLGNSNFKAGDWFWDMTITGDTGAVLPFLYPSNPIVGSVENAVHGAGEIARTTIREGEATLLEGGNLLWIVIGILALVVVIIIVVKVVIPRIVAK